MKKHFLILGLLAFTFTACDNQQQQNNEEDSGQDTLVDPSLGQGQEQSAPVSLEQVWATEQVLETPESVYYHAEEDILYVSNIVGDPSEKDGEGYISKLSLDGEIVEQQWVTGLDAPKGLAMMDGKLYVTNVDELVEINIASGEISNRYTIEGAKFLNDPVVADGKLLFTDMEENKIHVLENGEVNVWKDTDLDRPNGLAYNNGNVLVASNGLKEVSQEGDPEVIAEGIDASDGIAVVDNDAYLVSNWNGEVYYIRQGQEKVKVLDTKDQDINSADIEYVQERNLLLVPTFKDNRVVAYRLHLDGQ